MPIDKEKHADALTHVLQSAFEHAHEFEDLLVVAVPRSQDGVEQIWIAATTGPVMTRGLLYSALQIASRNLGAPVMSEHQSFDEMPKSN